MSRTAFPRLMLNVAAAALLTGTVAGQAQAGPVWHFPFKAAPYATNDHADPISKTWTTTQQTPKQGAQYAQFRQTNPSLGGRAGSTPRAYSSKAPRPFLKVSQTRPAAPSAIEVAHQSPGHHDALPHSGKDAGLAAARLR